jgi:hypothetical protein
MSIASQLMQQISCGTMHRPIVLQLIINRKAKSHRCVAFQFILVQNHVGMSPNMILIQNHCKMGGEWGYLEDEITTIVIFVG